MALNILDMKKAVTKKLKEAFPECNIYTKRVEQGMKAPAFHVDLVPYDAPSIGVHGRRIHYFVNCTFFPKVIYRLFALSNNVLYKILIMIY